MRFLFIQSQTLYAKVLIPLALRLLEEGHEVGFRRARPRLARFGPRYIRARPTDVAIVDRRALRFVARLDGLEHEWRAAEGRIDVTASGSADAVIGTTKDLETLRRVDVPAFAVGYQHLPVVASTATIGGDASSLFLERNPFTEAHRVGEILAGWNVVPNGFTHLDVVERQRPPTPQATNEVLVFHSGGWRGVDSDPGDGRRVSYAKQHALLERACAPLLRRGLRPVVKIHPLRARYHDQTDVRRLTRTIEEDHGGTIEVVAPDAWVWPVALRAAFVVTYGSSSIYELWSAGVDRVVVCDFEGRERSSKFGLFGSIVVETHAQYEHLLDSGKYADLRPQGLAADVADAYRRLSDGRATESAGRIVLDALGSPVG